MTEELNKPNFQGKWEHIRSENFDDFMRENGANYVVRKMASHSNPSVEITQDGEKFHIKLHSLFVTRESTFTVGDEYEEAQHNGIVMKIKPLWDDEKLVLIYEPKVEGAAKSQKHVRELDSEGNQMTLTLEIGDVVAKRFFKRPS